MRIDLGRHFPSAERGGRQVAIWWQARTRREQILLGGMAAVAAIWLLAAYVVLPLQAKRAQALADIRTFEALSARLRKTAPLPPGSAAPGGPPATILAGSAAQYGIAPAVVADGSGFRVTVTDVAYDALIRWIVAFEQSSNLRVVRMRLERRPAAGVVSADLTVRA